MALDKLFLTNFNQSFTIEYAMSFLHKIHRTKQSLLYPMSLLTVLLFAPNLAIAADGVWFDIHIMAAALTSGVFAVAFLHIFITYKVFGRSLNKVEGRTGLIMELPPYHKPHWKSLFGSVFSKMGNVLIAVQAKQRMTVMMI